MAEQFQKTILIPIFDGMVGRNILYTDVIKILTADSRVRVVIIPPKGKADYYQSQFEDGAHIFVDKTTFWKHDFFEFLSEKMFLHSIPTDFMRIRQVDWYWNKGKYLTYLGVSVLRILGHIRLYHRFLRLADSLFPVPEYVYEVYKRWQPDLVFAPTMIARDEVTLMRIARRDGKKTVGMFKSWDNPTSKAFLKFFPDSIIAHTEIMKREAVGIYGYPENQIVVTGVPQFDMYSHRDFLEPREQFFEKIGADPNKKLIVYAPAGDWMAPYDKEVLGKILDWIDSGEIVNAQVLLRLHPAYISKTEELGGRKNLVIERPGKHFKGVDLDATLKSVEFDKEEIRHLASTLEYAAVTINTASTMAIEGAIFDKPVILIGFDGERTLPYWKSVRRYYDRNHFIPIIRSNGATLVKNSNELLRALKDYFSNPNLHKDGRARIRREQGYDHTGKAGEQLGRALLSSVL